MNLEAGSRELVQQARISSIVPIVRTVSASEFNPTDFFSVLSDYGRKKGSVLLESADVVPKYGENSVFEFVQYSPSTARSYNRINSRPFHALNLF